MDSTALPEAVTDLDEYIFVVRARPNKRTLEQATPDNRQLERNLLYHYLSEMEAYRSGFEKGHQDVLRLEHLGLLVEYIRTAYALTTSRLTSLLKNYEIIYDLLWALFKPNIDIYIIILDAEKPAYYRYNSGKERTTSSGVPYFYVECYCLDFNGQVFGEILVALRIQEFQGAKRIDKLEGYPLEFHYNLREMKEYFVKCGKKFVSFIGQHYVEYYGNAFHVKNGEYMEIPVDSRIMVDVAYFRKTNSNYARPHINELARSSSSDGLFILFSGIEQEEAKRKGLDTVYDADLMIYSQTVYGWSFGNKRWPYDVIDHFVEGKGQGLIALLHGPSGVGKTLIVEGLSEYLWRPLYEISAGELGQDANMLEEKLATIFRLAYD
ncbi:MAG: hypothetical protein Q9217_001158 [Psora testacea]